MQTEYGYADATIVLVEPIVMTHVEQVSVHLVELINFPLVRQQLVPTVAYIENQPQGLLHVLIVVVDLKEKQINQNVKIVLRDNILQDLQPNV